MKPLKFLYKVDYIAHDLVTIDSTGKKPYSLLQLSGTIFEAELHCKGDKYSILIGGKNPTASSVHVDDQTNTFFPAISEEWAEWGEPVFLFPLVRGQDSTHSQLTSLPGFPFERGSKHILGDGDQAVEEEVALILQQEPAPKRRIYWRIGKLHIGRNMVKSSWEAEPSCFASGGVKATILLI